MSPARLCAHVCLLAWCAAVAACGDSTPSAPSGPPVNTNSITITAAGANPKTIQVALGSRVLFINNDSRPHWMASDPHPEHTDCPEFDQVGTLLPNQSRETGNLVVAEACGFHDHLNPDLNALRGQVTIR